MRRVRNTRGYSRKSDFVNGAAIRKVFVFIKTYIPKRYRAKIRDILLYYYVITGRFNPIPLQKICFFYKPEVPDFGKEFTYLKLGKKEEIANPNGYSVIFEADLPDNLSRYNQYFYDYSGLYALYKNDLIKEDHMLLIHYDTQIRHKKWIEIIEARVKENNVIYSEWEIDDERSEVAQWIYKRIDDIFLATHKQSFLFFIKRNKLHKIPNTSQFACSRETFHRLMEFLLPIYECILSRKDLSFKYAHLMERAWGLFFALEGYETVGVIEDTHSQSKAYGEQNQARLINIPILSTALERNVKSFSELLQDN